MLYHLATNSPNVGAIVDRDGGMFCLSCLALLAFVNSAAGLDLKRQFPSRSRNSVMIDLLG